MKVKDLAKNRRIIFLITRSIQDKLTIEEQTEFSLWAAEDATNALLLEEIIQKQGVERAGWNMGDPKGSYHILSKRIAKHKAKVFWSYVASAAAVIAICTGLWFFGDNQFTKQERLDYTVATTVLGGKNEAFLLTADGKKISISRNSNITVADEKIVDQTGAALYNSTNMGSGKDMLTAVTPNGAILHLMLADGSKVWLNAGSKLFFPINFAGLSKREVILHGEAYFEVKHDKSRPFFVKTNTVMVEDLGTIFNIKEEDGERLSKTTLLQGAVRVGLNTAMSDRRTLIPGQQLLVDGDKLAVDEVNTEYETAWRQGLFRFENESLPSVMGQLAKWYDIEVILDENVTDEGLYGSISRNKSLAEVLRMLEATGNIKFKLEGRRLTVKKAP